MDGKLYEDADGADRRISGISEETVVGEKIWTLM